MNPENLIEVFYPEDDALRRMLLKHSMQVRDKALAILHQPCCAGMPMDAQLVADGAMLHDVGIRFCHAPGILCHGSEPYIAHGVIGATLLREYAVAHGLDLEAYARICERHTGSGLTAEEIERQALPIPARDYLPETLEEKLICLADKFFSKSGDMQEKSLEKIRRGMAKFGAEELARFDAMGKLFGVL